jgi:hypothetical protein
MRIAPRVVLAPRARAACAAAGGVLGLLLGATPSPAAAPQRVTVAPGAGGPPVAIVWRTGRQIRGSALDGSGRRTLARLRHAGDVLATPSPDGRRIALVAGDRLHTLDLDGAALRDRGRVTWPYAVRWSPDGSRIAVVGTDRLEVCGATDDASAGCDGWVDELSFEEGATWSPDGTQVAVVREDLALVTSDGHATRVVERHPFRDPLIDYPSAPVWTRAGLTWSTLELRLEDGELAGVGRTRIRRLEPAGPRTLAVIPRTGREFQPFTAGGEALDGTILGVRTRWSPDSGTASLFDLRVLRPDGSAGATPVRVGPFDPFMGNASAAIAGTLADGRVALLVRGSERRRTRLYLPDPGRGLGRRVLLADEVAVATALPGNPTAP